MHALLTGTLLLLSAPMAAAKAPAELTEPAEQVAQWSCSSSDRLPHPVVLVHSGITRVLSSVGIGEASTGCDCGLPQDGSAEAMAEVQPDECLQ